MQYRNLSAIASKIGASKIGALTFGALFLSVSEALAQAVPPQGADGTAPPTLLGALMQMAPMLAICFIIVWFWVLRPQEARQKAHKALLESLKKGESVVTTGGIVGRIASHEGEFVHLEIAPGVKVKILTGHIARREKDETKAAA
jgi:preprotein translocase subunit YajC